MIKFRNEQELSAFYNELRKQENLVPNQFLQMFTAEDETKFLLNRRFKIEHGQDDRITDLQLRLRRSECPGVCMYIAELFQQEPFQKLTDVPYPQYEMTLKEYADLVRTYIGIFGESGSENKVKK